MKLGYPFMSFLGKLLPDSAREKLEGGFVRRNNRLTGGPLDRENCRILLLLPSCLQNSECTNRITGDVFNCKKCGKCAVSGLLTLSEKYNIIIKVATGGRIAKRIVNELAPDAVVAVACERELSEGIFAVYPVPVYGIVNGRPEGPCLNTIVSVSDVENIIKKLLIKK